MVGAGTMGHGIAQTFAQNDYDVALVDVKQEALNRAQVLVGSSLETLAKYKLIKPSQIKKTIARIKFTTSLEDAAKNADIAIEAVSEDRKIKEKVFDQFDKLCPPQTLLASNTTALNIFDIEKTSRPDKVLISHWYTPPQLIPLVDVVKGPRTSEESVQLMLELLKKIGKTPLLLRKFVSGYLISRLQIATLREIFYLLDNDIVTPEELDMAAKAGLALRMMAIGLVQRIDFGGLDLTVKNLDNPYVQAQITPPDYKPKKIYELVRQGYLGVKSGRGFYDYEDRSEEELCQERDVKLIKLLKVYNELQNMK